MPKKPVADLPRPAAMILAERLRAGVAKDPDYALDDLPTETSGVLEPGAMFHMTDASGARYRIRVIRQD